MVQIVCTDFEKSFGDMLQQADEADPNYTEDTDTHGVWARTGETISTTHTSSQLASLKEELEDVCRKMLEIENSEIYQDLKYKKIKLEKMLQNFTCDRCQHLYISLLIDGHDNVIARHLYCHKYHMTYIGTGDVSTIYRLSQCTGKDN